MTNSESDLRLWQLMSPTFPVGMYAWSAGMEYAVNAGWVNSQAKTQQWIQQQLDFNLKYLDLPILKRFYQAWQQQDINALNQWSDYLYASRESKELAAEDLHLGQTSVRVLTELGLTQVLDWKNHPRLSYLLMFTCACVHWHIELQSAAKAYVWAWIENQVAAAIKLVPIGHLAGQSVMASCMAKLRTIVEQGLAIRDDDIGCGLPGLAIASALHERQYTRLFRS